MPKTIRLTKGYSALVNDCDYEKVMTHKWYADVGKYTIYAKSSYIITPVRLHNFIMNPSSNTEVHHRDRNGLNCQRENLLIVNRSENMRFIHPRPGRKYKGVYFDKWGGRFSARITIHYRRHFLGRFDTEEEAALAYNAAGKNLLGEGNFEPNIITSSQEDNSSCLETEYGPI